MFRNKILLHTSPPIPLSSAPFLLIQLSLADPASPPPPSHLIELETLCCKLSRTFRLACFPQLPNIFVIYQAPQLSAAARVVSELAETLAVSDVSAEEEVKEASLIAKAVECGMRSVMLDGNWSCVAESTFVDSRFACSEERTYLHAVNVTIQSETDGNVLFLVSPDVLRFNRHKISDLVSSETLQRFDNGEEIILEADSFSTHCTILPFLQEGHVIGLSKQLPLRESFGKLDELWLFKYGLVLPSNYFIYVQLIWGGHMQKQWFPSSFVLQGPGLVPAPQTIRASGAVHAMESFVDILGAWNFFDRGLLKVQDLSSLGVGVSVPVWKTATSNLMDFKVKDISNHDTYESISEMNFISEKLLLALDFRTPKPNFGPVSENKTCEHVESQSDAMPSCKISLVTASKDTQNANSISSVAKFKPLFMRRTTNLQSTSTLDMGKGGLTSSKPDFGSSKPKFGPVSGNKICEHAERQSDAVPSCKISLDTASKSTDNADIISSSVKFRPLFVKLTSATKRSSIPNMGRGKLSSLKPDISSPKPKFGPVSGNKICEQSERASDAMPSCKIRLHTTSKSTDNADIISSSGKFRPLFTKLTTVTKRTSTPDTRRGRLSSSKLGCTESGRVNGNIANKENHVAPVINVEDTSMQMGKGNMQSSTKASRKKDKPVISLDRSSLADRGKGLKELRCVNDIVVTQKNQERTTIQIGGGNKQSNPKTSRKKEKSQTSRDHNSLPDRGKGSAKSGSLNDNTVTKESHAAPVVHMLCESTSKQIGKGDRQSSSKASRKKGKVQISLDNNSSIGRGKESGYVNDIIATKENHVDPVVHISGESTSIQMGKANMQSSSKASRKKEKPQASLDCNSVADRGGCAESESVNDIAVTKENHTAPVVRMSCSSKTSRKKERTQTPLDHNTLAAGGKGSAESGSTNDIIDTKENHVAPVVYMPSENTSIQMAEGNTQSSSKTSRKKENSLTFIGGNSSEVQGNMQSLTFIGGNSSEVQGNMQSSSKASRMKENSLTFIGGNSSEDRGKETGSVDANIRTKENHISPVAHILSEGTSVQMSDDNMQSTPKASREKETSETSVDRTLAEPGNVSSVEALGKRPLDNEMKGKDDAVKGGPKKRLKPDVDRSDILTKIADYYTRGQLQSLTVPDLKCFLSVKKAKVGGKKEELIQRITALFT